LLAQRVDHHPEVVEDAEARRAVAARVVHAADRLEGAQRVAGHDALERLERAAAQRRGCLEDAGEGRRVAVIHVAGPLARARLHPVDVRLVVEPEQLRAGGGSRLGEARPAIQALRARLGPEGALSVDRERMAVREAVAAQDLADEEQDLVLHAQNSPISAARKVRGSAGWKCTSLTAAGSLRSRDS